MGNGREAPRLGNRLKSARTRGVQQIGEGMTQSEPSQARGRDRRVRIRADAMYRIHEVSRLISTYFDNAMAAHCITRAQWNAIMHVNQNPGATQTELADLMQMGRAGIGKMLDRLEQKSWIERRPDENDSRVRRVYPHKDADTLFAFMPEAARRLYDDFYAGMGDAEVEQLHDALQTMRRNARLALGKDEPGPANGPSA